jgi:hypothetical protein
MGVSEISLTINEYKKTDILKEMLRFHKSGLTFLTFLSYFPF